MSRLTVRSLAVATTLAFTSPQPPAHAIAIDQSCVNPPTSTAWRNWAAPVLGQTFTPEASTLSRFSVLVTFRTTIKTSLEARIALHGRRVAGVGLVIVVASATTDVAGAAGERSWVTFELSEPIDVGAFSSDLALELVVPRSAGGSWLIGWNECTEPGAKGRAYTRAHLAGSPPEMTTSPAGAMQLHGTVRSFVFQTGST